MKITKVLKTEYFKEYGQMGGRGRGDPRYWEIWDKLRALPITEYMVIEPDKDDGDLIAFSKGLGAALHRIRRKSNANFSVFVRLNKVEKHVVIWKESK